MYRSSKHFCKRCVYRSNDLTNLPQVAKRTPRIPHLVKTLLIEIFGTYRRVNKELKKKTLRPAVSASREEKVNITRIYLFHGHLHKHAVSMFHLTKV